MEQLDYNLLYRWFVGLAPATPSGRATFTAGRGAALARRGRALRLCGVAASGFARFSSAGSGSRPLLGFWSLAAGPVAAAAPRVLPRRASLARRTRRFPAPLPLRFARLRSPGSCTCWSWLVLSLFRHRLPRGFLARFSARTCLALAAPFARSAVSSLPCSLPARPRSLFAGTSVAARSLLGCRLCPFFLVGSPPRDVVLPLPAPLLACSVALIISRSLAQHASTSEFRSAPRCNGWPFRVRPPPLVAPPAGRSPAFAFGSRDLAPSAFPRRRVWPSFPRRAPCCAGCRGLPRWFRVPRTFFMSGLVEHSQSPPRDLPSRRCGP